MESNNYFHNILPMELSSDDISEAQKFLDNLHPDDLLNRGKDNIKEFDYNGSKYRMLVDKPESGDPNKAILVSLGYATGITARSLAQAYFIRDFVDPEATLVFHPNSTGNDMNMNYSEIERKQLRRGNLRPVVGRIAVAMASIGNPKDLTIFGLSQGATVALAYASDEATPESAVAFFGNPGVIDRSIIGLAYDFARSAYDFDKVIETNFTNNESPLAVEAKLKANPIGAFKHLVSILHSDNLAMAGAICHETTSPAIKKIIDKGGNIVHSWGEKDSVSPNSANYAISDKFDYSLRYSGRRLLDAGHTAGHFYALMGVLTRLARIQKKRVDSIDHSLMQKPDWPAWH
ncbi:alpha/beta hydrolase [Candidatus Saccharibacteria bacterium]|nr:alpha/beta hydrolase [Candidatus Saccharibacteria bacterium]